MCERESEHCHSINFCIQLKLTSSRPRLFVPQEVKVVKGKCLSIVPRPDCRVDRQMNSTWSGLLHVKGPEGQMGCQVHSFFLYTYSLQAKSGLSVFEGAMGQDCV